jgi:RNA polymerase sigma-70 factor, ECF subfamily
VHPPFEGLLARASPSCGDNCPVTTGALDDFQAHRGRLFGIAYRMLGSATEAEDVLQDAWLRWSQATDDVRDSAAYLATIVTRLCLTAMDSARARRETYVGPWLPEPVATEGDPLLGAERGEALSLAVLLLLERLTPAERAAYVLREAFAYPFAQIAEVLETSPANARQLATRARAHLERERGAVVSAEQRDRLLHGIVAAAQSGNLADLEALLADDVVSLSDGGGVVSAARNPVVGRSRVARFVLGLLEKYAEDVTMVFRQVNGEPTIVVLRERAALVVWQFDVGPAGVRRMLAVLNPDKLHGFDSIDLSQN